MIIYKLQSYTVEIRTNNELKPHFCTLFYVCGCIRRLYRRLIFHCLVFSLFSVVWRCQPAVWKYSLQPKHRFHLRVSIGSNSQADCISTGKSNCWLIPLLMNQQLKLCSAFTANGILMSSWNLLFAETNEKQNQSQSHLVRVIFPALWASYW